ncbi:hypothetical protein MPER_13569, partial [Moniliophthora perniciosa FA553]
YNTDDRPLPNKFLSIQAMPPTSTFRSSTFGVGSPVTPVASGFAPGVGGGSGGHGHQHTRSVGSANDQQAPAQVNDKGPMSAAPGAGGGGFNISGGAFGGWRKW